MFKYLFGKKTFRAGGYAALAAAIVIALAVAANMIVGALPSSVTEYDLTSNDLYTLSDQTKRIVGSLDKDVTLYVLATEGYESTYTLPEVKLLARYAEIGTHLTVTYIDPVEYPTFASEYTSESVSQYDVIAVCGERSRLIKFNGDVWVSVQSENYDYYYNMYYYYGYTEAANYMYEYEFAGENAFTGAINFVSNDSIPNIAVMKGHGETDLSEDILTSLTRDNFTCSEFSFIETECIPEDADIVFISAPQSDISGDEAEALIEYLDKGGDIVIIADALVSDAYENLSLVTGRMGMKLVPGVVVEASSSNYYRYPFYLLPDITYHTITSALKSAGSYIFYPTGAGIEHTEEIGTYSSLLTSSSSAYSKLAGAAMTTHEKEEGDIDGAFDLAACVTDGEARMVLFTSGQFVSSGADSLVSGANSDLLLNSFSWMQELEDNISIRSKALDDGSVTMSSGALTRFCVLTMAIIPGVLLLAGIVIMVRRKRR